MKVALLPILLIPVFIGSMEIQKENLFIPSPCGKVRLIKTDNEFQIIEGTTPISVSPDRIETRLATMDKRQLAKFMNYGYIAVNKSTDGSYALTAHERLRGGGVFGAWLGSTIGYGAVTFAGYGAIHLVSACTGPLYGVTFATLSQMYAIPIHTVATTAGVALGITTAVATGPV